MTALATIDDLDAAMARDLTAADTARADRLFDIASTQVRTYTGRMFTATTETKRIKVRNGRIRLPQSPVTAVTGIADMAGNSLSFTWYAGQVIDLAATPLNAFEVEPYRRGLTWVDVTYTHGYDPVPADVVGVVCDMVAAALDAPPESVGLQSESLGPFSQTTGTNFAGGVRLTQTMRDRLAPYMAPVGSALLAT